MIEVWQAFVGIAVSSAITGTISFYLGGLRERQRAAFERRSDWYISALEASERFSHAASAMVTWEDQDPIDDPSYWSGQWANLAKAAEEYESITLQSKMYSSRRLHRAIRSATLSVAIPAHRALKDGLPTEAPEVSSALFNLALAVKRISDMIAVEFRRHTGMEPIEPGRVAKLFEGQRDRFRGKKKDPQLPRPPTTVHPSRSDEAALQDSTPSLSDGPV